MENELHSPIPQPSRVWHFKGLGEEEGKRNYRIGVTLQQTAKLTTLLLKSLLNLQHRILGSFQLLYYTIYYLQHFDLKLIDSASNPAISLYKKLKMKRD